MQPESHLFLVVEVHLAVSHLVAEAVHILTQMQAVLCLVRGLVQLLGQVEVLTVQLRVLLGQLGQLLLQVCDHLREGGWETYYTRLIASFYTILYHLNVYYCKMY